MTNTAHFNLPVAQATDLYNHLTIDNAAFNIIDTQMHANQNAAFSTATYSKTGNVHAIAEAIDTCPIMYFQATADFRSGDTFTVNGNVVTARLPNGSGLGDYAFRVNSNVISILNGGIFTVFTNVSQTDIAAMLGTIEQTTTATYQHSVGTYFIYGNNFYLTTVAIPIGGTITPGTNCNATTVGTELAGFATNIANLVTKLGNIKLVYADTDTAAYPISAGSRILKNKSGLEAGTYIAIFSWQLVSSGANRTDVSIQDNNGNYLAITSFPNSQSYPSITVVGCGTINAGGSINANCFVSDSVVSNAMHFQVIRIA